MEKHKETIYQQLMWDYNISPEEVDKLVKGKVKYAGHYDIDRLFVKMLNNFPYFIILQIFDIKTVKKLLTNEVILKLRFKEIQEKYKYVQKRLQEVISTAR